MPRGGKREGVGRPRGQRVKVSLTVAPEVAAIIEDLTGDGKLSRTGEMLWREALAARGYDVAPTPKEQP